MKSTAFAFKVLAVFILIGSSIQTVEAQFWKKLKKRAEQAAEETVYRKVEEKTAEKTDQAMDSIFDAPNKAKKRKSQIPSDDGERVNEEREESIVETDPTNVAIYSKFDFVPGDKVLFFDDYSNDAIGDFPSKWDTNGSGEIASTDNGQKWLIMANRSVYLPITEALPEEFTIEFDLAALNLSQQTSSQAMLELWLDETEGFVASKTQSTLTLPFCKYIAPGIQIAKKVNGKRALYNKIEKDIRPSLDDVMHISLAINKSRLRMWVNEKKVVDVPKLVTEGKANYLKLFPRAFKDGQEQLIISNLKIASGGLDLRKRLIEEGSFSTTGILFDSGSATIKAESGGVLKSIAQVIGDDGMNIKIIGHTDSDGEEANNLDLSMRRAHAVKQVLVNTYGIDAARIETDGKGESEPIADNTTSEGKAQNRRVEFIKL